MATSSSSSAAASFLPKRYGVFISFRGEDTRKGFVSHLRDALTRNRIQTYVDDRLNKGDEISPSLFEAIEDSHISIIVFSERYATSKWCLDELVKILECRKEGQEVIPVFYEVDPSNIRKLKRSYEEAFAKHECDFCNDQDKLTKWKQALREAANLSGWDSRKYEDESKLLQEIVEDVLKKLKNKYQLKESKYLSGINQNLAPVESLLREFQIIGIWGMGGMGKTTIAKWFFDKYSSQYEGSCFLRNIRERFGNDGQALRAELVSKLLDEHERINDVESCAVQSWLSCKRVFVVLDDVSASKQFECLVEEFQGFGSGSRIIITTRDKRVLKSKEVKMHNVKALNFQESLQLFSLNAFSQNCPKMDFEELSKRAVDYSKGTPLVLKVLGSFLHSKTRNEWECALKKLKRIPNDEIHGVLKLSYNGLNHEEREIFLDIAFFLKGMCEDNVVSLLESFGFYPGCDLGTLQEKALITIEHGTVEMHDLIQEMGWEIVRQESIKEPGERSRLRDPEEIYNVLKNNKGTNKIEGILLDMSKIRALCLNDDTFRKMSNLRFVKFYCSSNYGDSSLHFPSTNLQLFGDKLRYFQWDGLPSRNLSLMFCPENLVELLMPNSHFEKLWDGVQDLCNLNRIDLHGSKRLAELPDFSKSLKLKIVNLSYCVSLDHVHPSLLSLHSLVDLDLYCCTKLKSLESGCHLRSLAYLHLRGCTSLEKFSVSSEELRELDLKGTSITMLPSSIGRLSRLEHLRLEGLRVENLPIELSCLRYLKGLVISDCSILPINTPDLPVIFSGLQSLEELSLVNCICLFELPQNIGVLSSLRSLNLSGSSIECLPESIKQLTKLEVIKLNHCKRLASLPDLPPYLRRLDLYNCRRLRFLPELPRSITQKEMSLKGSNIECLPSSLKELRYLVELRLSDCKRLQSIPQLPQSVTHVDVRNCTSLRAINSTLWKNKRKFSLDLRNCVKLDGHVLSSVLENSYFSIKGSVESFFILPGSRVPDWFQDNRTTGNSITIKLDQPLQLRVVAFCVVFSQFSSNECEITFSGRCSQSVHLPGLNRFKDVQKLNSSHVYLWSSPLQNYIWSSKHDCNLSVEFVAGNDDPGVKIKECGMCPIYWD